jgi:Thaumatin family
MRHRRDRGTEPRQGGPGARKRTWWIAAVVLLVAGATLAGTHPWSGADTSSTAKSAAATSAALGSSEPPSPTVTLTATASPTRTHAAATPKPTVTKKPSTATSATTAAASKATTASAPSQITVPEGSREVTFVNDVNQTIWVAGAEQTAQPALTTTGWVLPAGQSLSIAVPNKWNGRFWGRTGCDFNSSGTGHCQTGDCDGRFQCTGYAVIPSTLAEFNLDAWDSLDFYDVSMVDGSNLPMYINLTSSTGGTKDPISSDGCIAAGCTKPVSCPSALQVDGGAGCESACGVFGTDQYCCRGAWASRTACQPTQWPVDYAAVFKQAEPYAYSYVDDDATSVFTCKGTCDYRITFGVTP